MMYWCLVDIIGLKAATLMAIRIGAIQGTTSWSIYLK